MKTVRQILLLALTAIPLFTADSGWCFYNPSSGRWLNRDPIEENGGLNVYVSVDNNFITKRDRLGLEVRELAVRTYIETATVTDPFGDVFEGDGPGARVGSGSFRTIHRILIETCGPQKGLVAGSEWKDTGITRKINPTTGAVVAEAKSTGGTLKATVTTSANSVTTKMVGDESNPLHTGAPGISYEMTVVFNTSTGRATFSISHDGFPAYDFMFGSPVIYSYSHLAAGASVLKLFPPMDVSVNGSYKIACCP